MSTFRGPISDQVRAALTGDDPELIREVQKLEQLAAGHVTHIASNGRFPHWSFERFAHVATLLCVVIGGIWFASGKWRGMELDVDTLKRDMAIVKADVQAISGAVLTPTVVFEDETTPAGAERRRPTNPTRPRPRPSFPPNERLNLGDGVER